MSFPANIIENCQFYYDTINLSNSQDFLYLQSLKDTEGISAKSINNNQSKHDQKEDNSNNSSINAKQFNVYSQLIEFENETYNKLRNEGMEQVSSTTLSNIDEYRKSLTEFYARNSTQINSLLQNRLQNPFTISQDIQDESESIIEQSVQSWNFDNIKGNNPTNWPKDLNNFIEEFQSKRQACSLFLEPEQNQKDFFIKAKKVLQEYIEKKIQEDIDIIISIVKSVFIVIVHRSNFVEIMHNISYISSVEKQIQQNFSQEAYNKFVQFLPDLGQILENNLQEILKIGDEKQQQLQYMPSFCNMGTFNIEHIGYLQKLGFLHTSLTCCERYLYLLLGSNSGAMLKIGTGKKDTIQGKVYLYKPCTISEEQITWVYIQNKLYYRTSSMGTTIQIYNPENFQSEGFIQLQCRELFTSTFLSQLNNKLQLLTDGNYLYIIGKLLNTNKIQVQEEEEQEEEPKNKQQKEEEEQNNNKKAVVKNTKEIKQNNDLRSQIEKKQEEIKKIQDSMSQELQNNKTSASNIFNRLMQRNQLDSEENERLQNIQEQKTYVFEKQNVSQIFGDPNKKVDLKQQQQQLENESKKKLIKKVAKKRPISKEEKRKELKPEKKESKKEVEKQQIQKEEKYCHILEFYLYKFDIDQNASQEVKEINEQEEEEINLLAKEIQVSFNYYYSLEECHKALQLNCNDIQKAAGWLVDEGQSERKKKTIALCSRVLLAQSQIVGNTKDIKHSELQTTENSLLFNYNTYNNCWTMDKNQICLYSEHGIKVFGIHDEDLKEFDYETYRNYRQNYINSGNQNISKEEQNINASIQKEKEINQLLEDRELQYNRVCDQIDEIDNQIDLATTKVIDQKAEEQLVAYQKARERLELEKIRQGDRLRDAEEQHSRFIQKLQQQKKLLQNKQSSQNQKSLTQNIKYKSTFIKVINKTNGYDANPRYNLCYNPLSNIYYTVYYSCNYSQFPALVTYSQQRQFKETQSIQNNKEPQNINQLNQIQNIKNTSDLLQFTLQKLSNFQPKRYQNLPWKFNSWEYFYGLGLGEIQQEKEFITRLEKDGLNLQQPQDKFSEILVDKKKMLQNQKQTLLKRINKQIEKNKDYKQEQIKNIKNMGKVFQEMKKQYAFCINGNLEELQYIYQLLEDSQLDIEIPLSLLYYWFTFSELLTNYQKNGLEQVQQISDKLQDILKNQQDKYKQLIGKIIIAGFSLIASTNEQQFKWFQIILEDQYLLKLFYKQRVKNSQQQKKNFTQQESIIQQCTRESEIQQQQIESNTKFNSYYKKIGNIEYSIENQSFQEPYGRLFMENIDYLAKIYCDNVASFEKIHNGHVFLKEYLNEMFKEKDENIINKEQKKENKKKQQQKKQKLINENDCIFGRGQKEIENDEDELEQQELDLIDSLGKKQGRKEEIVLQNKQQHKQNQQQFYQFIQQCFKNYLQQQDNLLDNNNSYFNLLRVFEYLQEKGFEELTKIQEGQLEWNSKYSFSMFILDIYYLQLDILLKNKEQLHNNNQTQQNQKEEIKKIIKYTAQSINRFLNQTYQSSISFVPSFQYIQKLNQLSLKLHELLKYFKKNLPISQQFFNSIVTQKLPGIHQSAYRIFQTSHPYEKGQQIFFDKIYWKDAIGIIIEQDYRNSSDQHDALTITGWYGGVGHGGNQNSLNNQHMLGRQDGLYSCYRFNGRQSTSQLKKPIFILGNSLKVEFQSQSQVRQGGDGTTMWGYKVTARPVYGFNQLNKNIYENQQYQYITTMLNASKLIQISLLQLQKNYIEQKDTGNKLEDDILIKYNLKDQQLFNNGLIQCEVNKYLQCNTDNNDHLLPNIDLLQRQIIEYNIGITSRFGGGNGGGEGSRINELLWGDSSTKQNSKNCGNNLQLELFSKIYNCNILPTTAKKPIKEQQEEEQKEGEKNNENKDIVIISNQSQNNIWDQPQLRYLEHIKEYVKQISENNGQFYQFAQELKSQMTVPNNYRMEKMRPNFKQEYKDLWEKCELLLILVQLYHNGLLQRKLQESVNEFIKGQIIQGIADTNRQVISFMISCIQDQKELQFCIESIHKKQNDLQLQYKDKVKEQIKQQQQDIKNKQIELENLQQEKQKLLQEQQQLLVQNGNNSNNSNGVKKDNEGKQKKQQQSQQNIKTVQKIGKKVIISTKKTTTTAAETQPQKQHKNSRKKKKQQKQLKEEEENKQVHEEEILLSDKDTQEIKKELEEFFCKDICNGKEKIKQICMATQCKELYNEDDLQSTSKQLFQICYDKLNHKSGFKIQEEDNTKLEFESPYYIVAKNIVQKGLFLLTLRNSVFQQQYQNGESNIQEQENNQLQDRQQSEQQKEQKEDNQSENNENQQNQQNQLLLQPPQMKRVISAPLSEKNIDKQKLQYFRQQMQSYQQFKQQQKENGEESQNNQNQQLEQSGKYVQQQIVEFFKLSDQNIVDSDRIVQCYERQNVDIARRIQVIQLIQDNNHTLKDQFDLQQYYLYQQGYLTSIFAFDLFSLIHCANKELKNSYIQQLLRYFQTIVSNFNQNFTSQIRNSTHQELLEKLQQQAVAAASFSRDDNSTSQQQQSQQQSSNQNSSSSSLQSSSQDNNEDSLDTFEAHINKQNKKCLTLFQDQIQSFYLQIIEIQSIFSSNLLISDIEFQKQILQNNSPQLLQFLNNAIELSLLCQNFLYLSPELQDLKQLSENLSEQVQKLLSQLVEQTTKESLVEQIQKIQLRVLQQELGFLLVPNDDQYICLQKNKKATINARILARIYDISGIERLNYLLQLVYGVFKLPKSNCKRHLLKQKNILENLAILLLLIIFHTQSPVLVKLSTRILKLIIHNINLQDITPPTSFIYKLRYFDLSQEQAQVKLDQLIQNLSKQQQQQQNNTISNNQQQQQQNYLGLANQYYKNIQDIMKEQQKENLIETELDFSQQQEFNNIQLLLQKVGTLVLEKQSESENSNTFTNNNNLECKLQEIMEKSRQQLMSKYSKKLNQSLKEQKQNQSEQFVVLCHLQEEEDVSQLLLDSLYHWENLNPTFTKDYPQNYEDYVKFCEQKKINDKKLIQEKKELQDQRKNQQNNNLQQNLMYLQQFINIPERIMQNLPYINAINLENQQEQDLPLGWQLNYLGLFSDFKPQIFQQFQTNDKLKVPAKKTWENKGLKQLLSKFQYLDQNILNIFNTQIEKEKENKEKLQLQLVKSHNFIRQILQHIMDLSLIANLTNILGFAPVLEKLYTFEQAQELADIMNYAIQKKVQKINLKSYYNEFEERLYEVLDPYKLEPTLYQVKSLTKEEEKKKEDSNNANNNNNKKEQPPPPSQNKEKKPPSNNQKQQSQNNNNNNQNNNSNSNMVIMICKGSSYPLLENSKTQLLYQEQNVKHENFYIEANSIRSIHSNMQLAQSKFLIIQELIDLLDNNNINTNNISNQKLYMQYLQQTFQDISKLEGISDVNIGVLNTLTGFSPCLIQGCKVQLKSQQQQKNKQQIKQQQQMQEEYILGNGGQNSGYNHCGVYSNKDNTLEIQNFQQTDLQSQIPDSIIFQQEKQQQQVLLDQEIFEHYIDCLQSLLEQKDLKINQLLVLRTLLQIASKLQWSEYILKQKNINQEKIQSIIKSLRNLVQFCPSDRNPQIYEDYFLESWQQYQNLNSQQKQLYSVPKIKTEEQQDEDEEEEFDQNEKLYDFINYENEVPSLQKEPSKIQHLQECIANFSQPLSLYNNSLPEIDQKVDKNYLLIHWQKHIFPKVEAYCKGTLQTWEVKMAIAQISNHIIQGQVKEAINELYIICDQKPPPGCDTQSIMAYQDTTTLPIDEIKVGDFYLCNISSTNNPQSLIFQFLKNQQIIQNKQIVVQAVVIDIRSSSIMVSYQDYLYNQVYTFWTHISQIKHPQIPIKQSACELKQYQIKNNFMQSLDNSIQLLSRSSLIQFFDIQNQSVKQIVNQSLTQNNLIKNYSLNLIELVKWTVLDELSNDPQNDWLNVNGNQILLNNNTNNNSEQLLKDFNEKQLKIQSFQNLLNSLSKSKTQEERKIIEEMINYSEKELKEICTFIQQKCYFGDLKNQHKKSSRILKSEEPNQVNDNNELLPLNQYICKPGESVSQIIVVFKQDSKLSKCSGLNLYHDRQATKPVQGIHAGKSEAKQNLAPLIFNGNQIYTQYYFDQSTAMDKDERDFSKLECLVYIIPTNWQVVCWLIDSIGISLVQQQNSKENIQLLQKLVQILIQNLQFLKGPNIIKQVLVKLITRNINKLIFLLQNSQDPSLQINNQNQLQILNISDQFIQNSLKEVEEFYEIQKQDKTLLYSSYLQDYIELLSTILSPIQQKYTNSNKKEEEVNLEEYFCCRQIISANIKIPQCIQQVINVQIFLNYIQNQQDNNYYKLTEDLYKKCIKQLDTENIFNNVLYLENLPVQEFKTKIELQQFILNTIVQNQGRILCPQLDIHIIQDKNNQLSGSALVILDEINILKFNNSEIQEEEEKKEDDQNGEDKDIEDEEELEEEEPKEEKKWACAVCTVHNDWEVTVCEVCGSPEPPNKQPIREEVPEEEEEELNNKQNQDGSGEEDLIDLEIKEYQEKIQQFIENVKKSINNFKKQELEKEKERLRKEFKQKQEQREQEEKEQLRQEQQKQKDQLQQQQQQQQQKSRKQKKLEKKIDKKLLKQQQEQEKEQEQELRQKQEQEKLQKIQEQEKQFNEQIDAMSIQEVKILQGIEQIEQQQDEDKYKQNLHAFFKLRILQIKPNTNIECLNIQVEQFLRQTIQEIYSNDENIELSEDFLNILQAMFLSEELEFDIQDVDEFCKYFQILAQKDSISAFKILQMFGLDFWFNSVQYLPHQSPKLLDLHSQLQMIQFVEIILCNKANQAPLNYPPSQLRLIHNSNDIIKNSLLYQQQQKDLLQEQLQEPQNYYSPNSIMDYKQLMKLTHENLKDFRYSWAAIRLLNHNLIEALKFINFSFSNEIQQDNNIIKSCQQQNYSLNSQQNMDQIEKIDLGISNTVSNLRNLCLHSIKMDLIQNVLKKTAKKRADEMGQSAPKVIIDRIKIAQQSNQAESSKKSQTKDFIFTSTYHQLKNIHTSQMRPSHEPFIAFDITLKGEQAQGQYGLYRQIFSDISAELQPNKTSNIQRNLNLLIPCENNVNKEGENQDKYIINPDATTSHDMQLYEFFGVLMGCCIRTGVTLALDLPRLFWKLIVGEKVFKKDLEEIEKSFQNLNKNIKTGSKEEVEYYLNELGLIDENSQEQQQYYSYENRFSFIDDLFKSRILSTQSQVQAIQNGLKKIVSGPLLKFISHQELEYMICGSKTVDFDMLKRHTEYKKPLKENSDLVKYFWQAVNELTVVEQLKFIKFCWAQERLPASDEEFEKKKINLGLKPALYSSAVRNPDRCLPKADTCFFNLELPNYSSKEVLKRQLLIAISFDNDAIDNDNDPNINNGRSRRYSYGDEEE